MRVLAIALLLTAFSLADPLDRALARAGTTREMIGFRPRSWWVRYPRAVPHKLAQRLALFAAHLRELHDQDRALGRQADQQHESDLHVDVVLQAADGRADYRAKHRERHRHGA